MIERKELKKSAKQSLKKHYWLFVAICLFAVFIGAEFGSSLDILRSNGGSSEDEGYETLNVSVSGIGLGLSMANSDVVEGIIDELLMGQIREGREMSRQLELR